MVDYVQGLTGNDLLDNHSAGYSWDIDWPYDLGYRWDSAEDIETLRRLYAEAKPVWDRMMKLCEWADEDEVRDALIQKIMGDGSDLLGDDLPDDDLPGDDSEEDDDDED